MLELKVNDYNKVIPLFKEIDHNVPVVFSVIEGNAPGKIYVDDLDNPKTAFLYPMDSFFYVGGYENNSKFNNEMGEMIFKDILNNSSEGEMVLFAFSEEWREKLDLLFENKGTIRIERKMFEFNQDRFNSGKINVQKELPLGFTLKEIDEKIAKKIEVTKSWQSVQQFIDKGVGQCIIKDDEIVSACYSIYKGRESAEIDIFTEESYRGKGLGKIVATSFIEKCISKGIKPNWACWPFRKASYMLAKKLGFDEKEDVQAHYWAPNM